MTLVYDLKYIPLSVLLTALSVPRPVPLVCDRVIHVLHVPPARGSGGAMGEPAMLERAESSRLGRE